VNDSMKNGVVKRGSTWSYVVRVTDATGARKSRWYGGCQTKAEAKAKRVEAQDRANRGASVDPTKITVTGYLSEWLKGLPGQVRPATLVSYSVHVNAHVVPALGSHRLQGLTVGQIKQFYGELLRSGRRDGPKQKEGSPKPAPRGLSPNTVRRIAATLHRALRDAVDEGYLLQNPCDKAKAPSASADAPHDMQTWQAGELRGFLDSVRGDRLYGLWRLLAATGMRRGEALGLRWQDVTLEDGRGRVSIRHTLVTEGYKVNEGRPKTKKGERVVNLDAETAAELSAQAAHQADDTRKYSPIWTDSGYVFTAEDGHYLHPDFVSRRFDALVKQAAVKRIRLHDLRHTFATLALQAGIHPKVVSEMLGHANISITLDTYSHAIPAMQADAADLVAALIAGAGVANV
jgi:integrase